MMDVLCSVTMAGWAKPQVNFTCSVGIIVPSAALFGLAFQAVWAHDERHQAQLGDIVKVQPLGYRIGPLKRSARRVCWEFEMLQLAKQ